MDSLSFPFTLPTLPSFPGLAKTPLPMPVPASPMLSKPLGFRARIALDLAAALERGDQDAIDETWAALCSIMAVRSSKKRVAVQDTDSESEVATVSSAQVPLVLPTAAPVTAPVAAPETAPTAPARAAKRGRIVQSDSESELESDSESETSEVPAKGHRTIEERFDMTAAWCNACAKYHKFEEFIRIGRGMRYMCKEHETGEIAKRQNDFYRRLATDSWFGARRHSWGAVGEIIRSAMKDGLDPKTCDLIVDKNGNAKFVKRAKRA